MPFRLCARDIAGERQLNRPLLLPLLFLLLEPLLPLLLLLCCSTAAALLLLLLPFSPTAPLSEGLMLIILIISMML